jgi:hypothetical protein
MLRLPQFSLSATQVRRSVASLAASSGMHALLLATLAVVVVKAHHAQSIEPAKARQTLPMSLGAPEGAGIDGSLMGATRPQQGDPTAPATPASELPAANGHFLLPSPIHLPSDPVALLPDSAAPLARIDSRTSSEEAQIEEQTDDKPAGGRGGGGAGYSFFGLQASGDRVVFVVDVSGSMKGRRLYRARQELTRSLESLRTDQQFFVIFFSDGALPMASDKMLPATSENVSETIKWLKRVDSGGGTNPLPGLLMAMQLDPDAIFLMTDGKFDPQIVWAVEQAKPVKPIPIYTISFASRSAEALLRAIAEQTGGDYRFVK